MGLHWVGLFTHVIESSRDFAPLGFDQPAAIEPAGRSAALS